MGGRIRQDDGEEYGATCLLDDGHEGPHEWTPDKDIRIAFAPDGAERLTEEVRE
jgi:hypothetical protein